MANDDDKRERMNQQCRWILAVIVLVGFALLLALLAVELHTQHSYFQSTVVLGIRQAGESDLGANAPQTATISV